MMVGLPRQDLVRAEQLLQEHHAGEEVRERHRAQRQREVGARKCGSERASDHEADVAPALAALLDPVRERLRRERPPVGVQQAHERALGDATGDRVVVGHFDDIHPRVPRQQLRVVREIVGIRRPGFADGNHGVAHGVGC
jgi:hypothetical protein